MIQTQKISLYLGNRTGKLVVLLSLLGLLTSGHSAITDIELLTSTVRIINNELDVNGTASLISSRNQLFLVTAKHLVGKYEIGKHRVSQISRSIEVEFFFSVNQNQHEKRKLKVLVRNKVHPHPNPYIDLAIIELGEVRDNYPQLLTNALKIDRLVSFQDVRGVLSCKQGCEAVVLGYPGRVRLDPIHAIPVYTRIVSKPGIRCPIPISTQDHYHDKFFILDRGVYGGHSGSPLIYEENHHDTKNRSSHSIHVIGMVFGGIDNTPYSFAISADYILDLFTEIQK